MNTQDSDEDALFRQEMRYPEASPVSGGPVQGRAGPLDVSEYLTASEAGSERGWSRHRGHQEDRPSASREEIGGNIDQEDHTQVGSLSAKKCKRKIFTLGHL